MSLSRLAPPRKRRTIKEVENDDNEVDPSRDDLITENKKLRKEIEELVKKNAEQEFRVQEQEIEITKLKGRLEVESTLRKEYQVKLGIPVKEDPTVVFPLLSLPKEIISYIYSFLPIKDRMRARLNKKLDAIELNSNNAVKRLTILEVASKSLDIKFRNDSLGYQHIYALKRKKYSSEGIKRILRSTAIERLTIRLSAWKMPHFEIFNMIKDFNFGGLDVHIEEPNKKKPITVMDDSLFLGLTRSCKHLSVVCCDCDEITPEALHQVYKGMKDGSANLRELVMEINANIRRGFLHLIDISFQDGSDWRNTELQLSTTRNIEAYMLSENTVDLIFSLEQKIAHIFDGNLEIILRRGRDEFKMLKHETQTSLDEAKNRKSFVRIDLTPK